jgi:hypothetical protein
MVVLGLSLDGPGEAEQGKRNHYKQNRDVPQGKTPIFPQWKALYF